MQYRYKTDVTDIVLMFFVKHRTIAKHFFSTFIVGFELAFHKKVLTWTWVPQVNSNVPWYLCKAFLNNNSASPSFLCVLGSCFKLVCEWESFLHKSGYPLFISFTYREKQNLVFLWGNNEVTILDSLVNKIFSRINMKLLREKFPLKIDSFNF